MSTPPGLPPVPANVIDLAIAEIALYAALLPLAVWVAWKDGKKGMLTWPILISFFGMRFIADAVRISMRAGPLLPSAVSVFTDSGSVATLILTPIGLVYQANLIVLGRPSWTQKSILGVTHLLTTLGTGLASFGGSPSSDTGKASNPRVEQVGFSILIVVLLFISLWSIYTARYARHMHKTYARWASYALLGGAFLVVPVHGLRIVFQLTYAITGFVNMDPIFGDFATKLVPFVTQLIVAGLLVVAGIVYSTNVSKTLVDESSEELTVLTAPKL